MRGTVKLRCAVSVHLCAALDGLTDSRSDLPGQVAQSECPRSSRAVYIEANCLDLNRLWPAGEGENVLAWAASDLRAAVPEYPVRDEDGIMGELGEPVRQVRATEVGEGAQAPGQPLGVLTVGVVRDIECEQHFSSVRPHLPELRPARDAMQRVLRVEVEQGLLGEGLVTLADKAPVAVHRLVGERRDDGKLGVHRIQPWRDARGAGGHRPKGKKGSDGRGNANQDCPCCPNLHGSLLVWR